MRSVGSEIVYLFCCPPYKLIYFPSHGQGGDRDRMAHVCLYQALLHSSPYDHSVQGMGERVVS